MNSKEFKKIKIPNKPGVYLFKREKAILYIGKATDLKSRVGSYFSNDLIVRRGPLLLDMTTRTNNLEYQVTDSVLEALILEANLIKKYKPKYNTKEKDNKSFNYICITKDILPKVLIVRGRGLNKNEYNKIYGPFPNGLQLREAMKIIRRIFPYIDNDSIKKNNIEFYKQLGLIPELYKNQSKRISQKAIAGMENKVPDHFEKSFLTIKLEYKNNIKNLKLFFEGKKKSIIINLKKEMSLFANKKEFEKAGEIKKKIFALTHINDVSLLKDEILNENILSNNDVLTPRIEAYDVAHMGGKNMVGVMTVIESGEANKSLYRKFNIKTQENANDTGALEEILSRRLRHIEWGLPGLIVVDGSTAQINVAKRVLNRYQFSIPVVGVVKGENHKPKAIIGDENLIKINKKNILIANNEAHRFAITFHKLKRGKVFLNII